MIEETKNYIEATPEEQEEWYQTNLKPWADKSLTIVAFASLVLSDIKPVIDFGYMMTLGLIVTFVTSFLLFPSILCLLKKDNKNWTKKSLYNEAISN